MLWENFNHFKKCFIVIINLRLKNSIVYYYKYAYEIGNRHIIIQILYSTFTKFYIIILFINSNKKYT